MSEYEITESDFEAAVASMTDEQDRASELRSMAAMPKCITGSVHGERVLGGAFRAYAFCMYSMYSSDEHGLITPYYFVSTRQPVAEFHGKAVAFAFDRSRSGSLEQAEAALKRFSHEEIEAAIDEGTSLRVAERIEWLRELHARNDRELAALRAAKKEKPPRKPKELTRRRTRIFNKSGGKCHYCLTALELHGVWHIEHLTPRSLDGGNEDANLAASCVSCNQAKKDKTESEFMAEIRSEPA